MEGHLVEWLFELKVLLSEKKSKSPFSGKRIKCSNSSQSVVKVKDVGTRST